MLRYHAGNVYPYSSLQGKVDPEEEVSGTASLPPAIRPHGNNTVHYLAQNLFTGPQTSGWNLYKAVWLGGSWQKYTSWALPVQHQALV
jgi:hypothetical protein